MRKSLFSFAALALVAVALSSPSLAQNAAVSHADVFKAMGSGSDDKVKEQLVGKTYEGKLIRTGPTTFMAKFGDGVYFACDQSTNGYKGGDVKAPIKSYETLPGGESMIGLTHCSPSL